MIVPAPQNELISKVELARSMAFVLAAGDDAKRELVVLNTPKDDTEPQPIPELELEPES